MTANDNPLLDFSGLPRFDAIRPEHVTPAVDALLADGHAAIERICATGVARAWPTALPAAS